MAAAARLSFLAADTNNSTSTCHDFRIPPLVLQSTLLTRLGNRAGATEHALPLSASQANLLISGSRKKPIVPVCTHVCVRMYVYVDMHVCVLCMYVMHVCMACMCMLCIYVCMYECNECNACTPSARRSPDCRPHCSS